MAVLVLGKPDPTTLCLVQTAGRSIENVVVGAMNCLKHNLFSGLDGQSMTIKMCHQPTFHAGVLKKRIVCWLQGGPLLLKQMLLPYHGTWATSIKPTTSNVGIVLDLFGPTEFMECGSWPLVRSPPLGSGWADVLMACAARWMEVANCTCFLAMLLNYKSFFPRCSWFICAILLPLGLFVCVSCVWCKDVLIQQMTYSSINIFDPENDSSNKKESWKR